MQLLYSNPLPRPEFVSVSLVLEPDSDNPNGSGMGEPLMLASPLSTISYHHATEGVKELHKYLTSLHSCLMPKKGDISVHDQIVAHLMQDDGQLLDRMQVFRPMTAHGIGLHYRLLREDHIKTHFSTLVLSSSRANTGTAAAETENRKVEKDILGVLISVGISGLPYAHCSSSLQYGLAQRMNDCVSIMSDRIMASNPSVDVAAAKTILSTLLATEDEVRKTNEVADSAHFTAIPESGEDGGWAVQKKKQSALKSFKRMSVKVPFGNFPTLGLLSKTTGETNMHVGLDPTSNDLARVLIERLTVLSVAEDDTLLRPYETSGQQRKANLDLTGNKSRFRKRKTDAASNADLDNFDYRGPVRPRRPDRLRPPQQPRAFNNDSPVASVAALQTIGMTPSASASSPVSRSGPASKGRHHEAKGGARGKTRAVPTLSAPRGDVSSSRRTSAVSLRSEDQSPMDDDTRSRRSAKNHAGRRASGDITPGITASTEDTSDSRSISDSAHRIQVNIALNEDLTCSYKFSKMTACSVEGVIQVQLKTNARSVLPFQLVVRDPSEHIHSLQENKKFAEDTSEEHEGDPTDRVFTVAVPKAESYFPLIRYKCSSELRPVPIRVQTRVKVDSGFCRVALQISSNPHNEGSLTDLTIIMGVANDIKGETLITQPAGGVWNASKRSVIWCVSELGDGEKFQLQARFEMDPDSEAGEEVPKFPVLVRCQCMYAQLSDVEVAAQDLPDAYPAEVAMKVARRFRLSHQERS